jgi:hypothetical protein
MHSCLPDLSSRVYCGCHLGCSSFKALNTSRSIVTSRVPPACCAVIGERKDTLSYTDVTIAAIAMTHGLPLLTDNRKHFPMEELKLLPLP